MRVTLAAIVFCLVQLLLAPHGLAGSGVFDEANAAFDAGRYDAALAGFIDCASGGAERDLACRCTAMAGFAAKAVGERARARLFFGEFERTCQEPPSDADDQASQRWAKMLAAAKSEVAGLEEVLLADHGVVHVISVPRGAVVRVDGRVAGALQDVRAPTLLYLEPGSHTLQLTAEGRLSVSRTVDVRVGAREMVRVELEPDGPSAADPPTRPPVTDPRVVATTITHPVDDPGPSALALAGWATLGAGLGVAATGVAFTVLAHEDVRAVQDIVDRPSGSWSDADRNLDASLRRRATARQDASIGLYVAGGALAATGLTLALIDMMSAEDAPPAASAYLAPALSGLSAGLTLGF